MQENYWNRTVLARQITRRRALALSGATGVAAFLAACGGSDNGSSGGGSSKGSSLAGKPADTTSNAKPGGIMPLAFTTEPTDFNPLVSAATTSNQTSFVYSRLLKHKVGKYPTAPDGSVEADAAQSWEISPDQTQVTFKLRPNMPFDPRPPTNGRALTAADVKYSVDTFAAKNASRSDLFNSVSPSAPIQSISTPDDNTVVFKLAFPYASMLDLFAWPNYFQIVPKEAEGGFDPRRETRGSGAWIMDEYKPSAYVRYKRNPGWYVKDRPFLDGIEAPIITEYATGLGQFRTGHLATYPVRADDILDIKQSSPALQMLQTWYTLRASPYNLSFGYKPGTPFVDQRVRQAVSMLIDRDAMQRAISNADTFEKQGLNVPLRWNSTVSAGDTKYWLNPATKDLGDAALYFSHNPAEAKKMLSAAGITTPLKTKYTYTTNGYADPYVRQAEILRGMLADSGNFELDVAAVDYQSVFRYGFSDQSAADVQKLEGIYLPGPRPAPNVDFFLFTAYHSQGSKVKYWPPDSTVDAQILKQRAEADEQKRIGIVHDLQKYLTPKMYSVPYDGQALGFTLTWPWIGNTGAFGAYATTSGAGVPAAAGAPQEALINLYYDGSKKT